MKKQSERLIYLNRATAEAIWEWDISSGQVYRNKQLEELTGFDHEETKDLSWWFNRIHENDRERVQSSVAGKKNTISNAQTENLRLFTIVVLWFMKTTNP